jgi:hypothetical protein
MSHTRRTFLRDASASLAAVAAAPYSLAHAQRMAGARSTDALLPPAVPLSAMAPDISALRARALDAARMATLVDKQGAIRDYRNGLSELRWTHMIEEMLREQ